jgi:hypothetical protein
MGGRLPRDHATLFSRIWYDVIVARQQKGRGMQWSEAMSDALAALRTLMLNGGWDRYWQQREVLPLVAT